MKTKEKLTKAVKDAMRAKDDVRKRTLRLALSSIKLAEVEKREPLDEPALLAILHKEVKLRKESITDAKKADRQDLIDEANAEIAVLQEFLPQPFTQEELEDLVKEIINQVNASSMAQMGQVMKVLIPRLEGRATGKEANQMVRKLLQ